MSQLSGTHTLTAKSNTFTDLQDSASLTAVSVEMGVEDGSSVPTVIGSGQSFNMELYACSTPWREYGYEWSCSPNLFYYYNPPGTHWAAFAAFSTTSGSVDGDYVSVGFTLDDTGISAHATNWLTVVSPTRLTVTDPDSGRSVTDMSLDEESAGANNTLYVAERADGTAQISLSYVRGPADFDPYRFYWKIEEAGGTGGLSQWGSETPGGPFGFGPNASATWTRSDSVNDRTFKVVCWFDSNGNGEYQSDEPRRSVFVTVIRVGMTAYRPTTEGPAYNNPFQRREIPEAQEETPGAGIRVNGDDDNVNSTPDRNDTTVNNENDLIEVVLDAAPTAPASGFKYVLKRSSSNIKVWNSQTKGTAWLDANDETNLTFSTTPMTVWVENPNGGAAALELQAKTDSGTVVCSDKVHFYPFTSVVIVFGGEFQDTVTDPPPAGAMIYSVATRLFQDGYDAHMYEEPDGDDPVNTEDTVFDEIVSAVNARQVTAVAVLGYSHGGGSTWRVADRLNTRQPPIGLQFSAYVDAVTQDAITQETRRPPGSAYHANYYQEGSVADGWLDGGPIDNPPGANHQVNLDDPTATETHTTIDDEPAVLDDIVQRLSGQVNR